VLGFLRISSEKAMGALRDEEGLGLGPVAATKEEEHPLHGREGTTAGRGAPGKVRALEQ
jgi:hypothetical protein